MRCTEVSRLLLGVLLVTGLLVVAACSSPTPTPELPEELAPTADGTIPAETAGEAYPAPVEEVAPLPGPGEEGYPAIVTDTPAPVEAYEGPAETPPSDDTDTDDTE